MKAKHDFSSDGELSPAQISIKKRLQPLAFILGVELIAAVVSFLLGALFAYSNLDWVNISALRIFVGINLLFFGYVLIEWSDESKEKSE